MAGGKGLRFGKNVEKPLAELMGKSLITRVIEATKKSKKISKIYVAATAFTPRTAERAEQASVEVIKTAGLGYHLDLQQAVQEANLMCPVLVISSDLPLLTGKFLDEIIGKYEKADKAALTVLVPEKAFKEYGISAVSPYEHDGKMFGVSGINIIDGRRISEEQEQEVIITNRPEALFNVNSSRDLELAKEFLLRAKVGMKQN